MKNSWPRIAGVLALVAYTIYLTFLIPRLNGEYLFLSLMFVIYNIFAYFMFIVFVFNTWYSRVPAPRKIKGDLPKVAILIPTWKEPVRIVRETVTSILKQDYPESKLVIGISDDSANPEMQQMLIEIANTYPAAEFIYNVPPAKSSPSRQGEGKAGNLNSIFELVERRDDIEFIETRDADDLVGHPEFLKHALGQLVSNLRLAYIQTTKTVLTDSHDTFGGKQEFFYRSLLLYKNGSDAIFPCGSGLVWRKVALQDIGGFPSWNLVEDYQSGAEALRRGWRSEYLPLVGAIGQVSPDDIPNFYKQRGTWALDSIRFFLWGNKTGMNFRQRVHFAESALFYFFSIATYLYAFVLAFWLFQGAKIFIADPVESTIYYFSWLVSLYVFIRMFAVKGDIPMKKVLFSIQNMFSLAPVYISALLRAIRYGPKNKPAYVVTRKTSRYGIYVFRTIPQVLVVAALVAGIVNNILYHFTIDNIFDAVTIGWAIIFILIYLRPVANSFYGVRWFSGKKEA